MASVGKITKSSVVESKEIVDAFSSITTAIEASTKALTDLKTVAGTIKNFKDLTTVSAASSEEIKKLNTQISSLQTVIKKLEKDIVKLNTTKKKESTITKEQTRLEKANAAAKEKHRLRTSALNKETIKLNAQTNAYNAALRKQATGSKGLLGSLKSLTQSLRNVAVAYFGFTTLLRGVKDIFNVTKALDSIRFSQEKIIKSQVEFAQTQQWLSGIINDYGLDLITVTNRYTKFRAATVSSNLTALQTQKIFGSMSKAAATLGLKTDELQGVYLALEQMISKNKVTTEELRRQLGERLPGAFDIMAKSMGVTTNELNKMLRAGVVMSEEVLPGFADAVEKAYGIESVQFVDTLIAAQNRLRTAWIEFVKLLEGADFFKGFLNSMASAVRWIGDNINAIKNLGKAIVLLGVAYTSWKLTMVAVNILSKISLTNTLADIAAKGIQTTVIMRLTAAQLRFNAALRANQIGLVIAAITTLLTLFSLYKKEVDAVTKSEKSFNDEVNESKNRLESLFESLQNAEIGTEEWNRAKIEINKTYEKYLDNLITEETTASELILTLRELQRIEQENIAVKRKQAEISEVRKERNESEAVAVEKLKNIIDKLNSSGKGFNFTQEQTGKLIAQFIELGKNAGTIDPVRFFENFKEDRSSLISVNSLVLRLVNSNREFEDSLKRITSFYKGFLSLFKKEEPKFNFDNLTKSLDAAKKKFGEFAGLRSKETKALWIEENEIIKNSEDNYRKYLDRQLELYKGNGEEEIRARAIIEQRISDIKTGGGSSSGRNKELDLQKQRDKISLQIQKEGMEISLANKVAQGASEFEIDQQIFLDKQALLKLEIKLNNERKEKFAKTEKERLDIDVKNTALRAKLAENLSDKQISDAQRARNEKIRSEEDAVNNSILLAEKHTSRLIDLELEKLKNREISAEQYAKNIEEIERDLQDTILAIQLDGLKKQLKIQGLKPEEYARIQEQITSIEGAQEDVRKDKSKMTAEELIEFRKEIYERSKELINAGFDAFQQSLENQLMAAEAAKNFSVALAGSNTEERIKAERKFEKESLKIRQRQAIAQKAQGAFNIITNTADAITEALPNIPLAILVGALGAFQLATVLSTPIPKFEKGGKHKGGKAEFSEGDKSELFIPEKGQPFLTPAKHTIAEMPAGEFFSHNDTQNILAQGAMNSAYERVDMGRSERYLKDIRDKSEPQIIDGYKYAKKRGNINGKYRIKC